MTRETAPARRPLLLYLTSRDDLQRCSVGPALAAVADAAGWGFEVYVDAPRAGRHFGAGAPEDARPGWPDGSLVLGGAHGLALGTLALRREIVAVGDGASLLWPVLESLGADALLRSADPVAIQLAVHERLGQPVPALALVLDASPQGGDRIVTAPYLAPRVLDARSLALDVTSSSDAVGALVDRGVRFRAVACDPDRLRRFPVPIPSEDVDDTPPGGWGAVTAALAAPSERWGRGLFLGDPDLVAANVAKIARLRLVPVHGRPTADALDRLPGWVERAAEPIFGRQWDDQDFFLLAARGRGLHVVDPPPPFDEPDPPATLPSADAGHGPDEPTDAELARWADERRILATVLFWTGMLREIDGLPRLVDLIATTGIHAGLVVTAETIEHLPTDVLATLAAPAGRGGVAGHVELLLGSTGRGVAAEHLLPAGVLARSLAEALGAFDPLPDHLRPVGWWPLLDAPLTAARRSIVGLQDGRPVVWFSPRSPGGPATVTEALAPAPPRAVDARAVVGSIVRRTGADRLLAARRPFQDERPGRFEPRIAAEVQGAGLEYMWTKADFGQPRISGRDGRFVALPFTAGAWDGWSPFYTVRSRRDLARAASELRRRGGPGWLASTVDSPLFAMSGELFEHGHRLHDIASALVDADELGVINVLPRTIARYARLIDDRAAR